jgi:hypothetical protein
VQIKHVETSSGLEVPLDKQGADYLVLLSSMEIINFPEYLEAITKIFDHAGVSWTLSQSASRPPTPASRSAPRTSPPCWCSASSMPPRTWA